MRSSLITSSCEIISKCGRRYRVPLKRVTAGANLSNNIFAHATLFQMIVKIIFIFISIFSTNLYCTPAPFASTSKFLRTSCRHIIIALFLHEIMYRVYLIIATVMQNIPYIQRSRLHHLFVLIYLFFSF